MGAHSVSAFRASNSTFRIRVSVTILILVLIACVVPATVAGIVVAALDFLLNDHVPSTVKSCATSAASVVRATFLESPSLSTSALTLAALTSRLAGWEFSHFTTNTTATSVYHACGRLATLDPAVVSQGLCDEASWHNGSMIATVLNQFVPWLPSLQGGRSEPVLSQLFHRLMRGGNTSGSEAAPPRRLALFIAFVQRVSTSAIRVDRLTTMNESTQIWEPLLDSNTSTSRLVQAASDSTTKFLVVLDPIDGVVSTWYPASEPALQHSRAFLEDGLYLEVTEWSGPNVTVTAPSSGASAHNMLGMRSADRWEDVFSETMLDVYRLSSSSSSTTASAVRIIQPSVIAVYHTAFRLMTVCAEDTSGGLAPPAVLASALPISSEALSSQRAMLDGLPGCTSLYRFLLHHDVDSPLGEPRVVESNYVVWASLSGWGGARNSSTGGDEGRLSLSPTQRAADAYNVVVLVPQGIIEGKIIQTRGEIAVLAFVVAAVTITVLVATVRLLTQPLPAITKAIDACSTLQLQHIEMMEASIISELAEIQRALNYLAMRLHHYIKFLPDRRVIDYITTLSSSSDEDDSSSSSGDEAGARDGRPVLDGMLFDAGGGGLHSPLLNDSSLGKKQRHGRASKRTTGETEDDAEFTLEEKLVDLRRLKHPKAPVHSILVDLIYESRHLHRNTVDRWKTPNKSAQFVFKHRVTDPVLSMLTRQCREHLHERPGEVLLIFSGKRDGTDFGMRQLFTDEDVLFAFEQCKTSKVIAQLGSSSTHSNSSAAASSTGGGGDLPVLSLCIRKGSTKTVMPVLIALGTFFSVVSRFVLSIQRLSADDTNTQLLGLTLLGCLCVQVAQNALISLYLVRRFRVMDRDFRAWADVSHRELLVGVVFGSLNVTNLEVMSCHVRLSQGLRLSAPLSPRLRAKISIYSFVGFIIGDLLPFVFILIHTILTQQYQDPFVLIPVVFSVLSVASILVSHGVMRFVISGRTSSMASRSGGGSLSTSTHGSNSGPSIGRSLLLARREITVLCLRITAAEALLDMLSLSLVDKLVDQLYDAVQRTAKRSGGLLLEAQGLSLVVAWNSHNVVPNHTAVGFRAFLKIREEVEKNVLTQFFACDKMRHNVASSMPVALRSHPQHVTSAVRALHAKHRLVGSLLTGDMSMGYVGTLTSQSFQRVGSSGVISDSLCRLNELYGSTLLSTRHTVDSIRASVVNRAETQALLLTRKIDEIVLTSELATSPGLDMLTSFMPASSRCNTGAAATVARVHKTLGNAMQRSQCSLPTIQRDSAPIEVHELIVSAFPGSNVDASTSMGAVEAQHTPISQHRLRPRATKVYEVIGQFLDAMEVLRTFQNPAPMQRYLELNPDDVVAARVYRWAQFLEAPNRTQAIYYPRVLSSLGISRHPCETPEGSHLDPLQEPTDTERVMTELQQRMAERNKLLRPPRSERRAKALAAASAVASSASLQRDGSALGVSGASGEVVEQVLAARGTFTVSFHQGCVVNPVDSPRTAATPRPTHTVL